MCGRFERHTPLEKIAEDFRVDRVEFEAVPSYNIAPSQNIAAIIQKSGITVLTGCRWGFISPLARGGKERAMINARAETVATKPAFRSAFSERRCLVVADGFFEWKKTEKGKVPFYVHLRSGAPFGFAGLYNVSESPEGEKICTAAIITTDANKLLKELHDRMPVILPKEDHAEWLDGNMKDTGKLARLLVPFDAREMETWEVSNKVNSPAWNEPEAIEKRPISGLF